MQAIYLIVLIKSYEPTGATQEKANWIMIEQYLHWHDLTHGKGTQISVVQIPTRWQSKHSLQCHVLQSLSFSFVWSLIHLLRLRFVCGACDRRDCEEIPAGVELRWWCWDSRKPWKIVMKAKMAETDNGWNLYRTLCKSEFQAKASCHETEGFCCRVNPLWYSM